MTNKIKKTTALEPFLILLLAFAIPSGNLSSADRGQNIGSEWKSIGKEIKQGSKDWVDEMLKSPESFRDNARLVVPDDTSAYFSDFQIGGAVSLPSGIGFTGTLQEEASLDIGIGPILGCGGLNSIASVKNSFKQTVKNAPRKLLTFVASAAKTLIGSAPMLLLAMAWPTGYEYITNELGISLTGFFNGELPSCEQMQDAMDEALKESADKKESEKRAAVGEAAVSTLKKGVMSSIGVKWKAQGKESSWSSEEYTQKKLEEEAKKGYVTLDRSGAYQHHGGDGQPSLDLAETAMNAGLRVYDKAVYKRPTSEMGLFGRRGIFAKPTGMGMGSHPIDRDKLLRTIIQLVGNEVVSYNPNSENKTSVTSTPALGIDGLGDEADKAVLTGVKVIFDRLQNSNKSATAEDARTITYLSGGAEAISPEVLDILAKGIQEKNTEIINQYSALTDALGRYRLIMTVSAVHALLNMAQGSQVAENNELFSTWVAAAVGKVEKSLRGQSLEEAYQKVTSQLWTVVSVIVNRDEEKKHAHKKP